MIFEFVIKIVVIFFIFDWLNADIRFDFDDLIVE